MKAVCGNHILSTRRNLRRQAHALKQVFEAQVGMQRVKDRSYVNENEELRVFFVCLSEHFESVITLAEPDIDKGDMERRNIVLPRLSPQLSQDRPSLRFFSGYA